jgi:hypothetical protein
MKKMFVLLVMCSAVLYGQMRGPFNQRPMERLESYKKVRMLEAMKLDEDKGLKLISRYDKHRETIRSLEEDRRALVDKLEEKVNAGASEGEYQKSFNELIEIEKKIFEARTKYLSDLKDILTSKQLAEYLVFERSFARDIRDIMRENQKEHMKK